MVPIFRIIRAVKEGGNTAQRRGLKMKEKVITVSLFASFSAKSHLYSPDLAFGDLFMLSMPKQELLAVPMTPEEFMKEWGRLLRSIPKEVFTRAVVRCQERFEKCINNGSTFEGEILEKNLFSNLCHLIFINSVWNPPRTFQAQPVQQY
jgi:hypothetical protein